ncbi:hypothetical protein HPB49_016192 [Dermacentor silvarum]|uniref:Uncharacterized protein n=1 Tax=Dermacentor silvarum TaxID=543639 RepID=A0ACB8D6I3_DERSI|nr:hypothetical protein HPB49_016192 [Dermacentor silvarum]
MAARGSSHGGIPPASFYSKNTVHIVADAWKALTAGTIHRCFSHAGFVAGVESDAATQDPAPELPATVPDVSGDELIEDLRSSGVPIPATLNFGNFANVDSATVSCAELTDEEIVNEVLAPVEEDSDSEENATCAVGPTNGDLAQALAVLSSCFSEDVTLGQIQADLVLRKRNTVQQSIEQFFQPQVL